ncbi:uncharacterized protein EMH_0079970 [Eimeria mitis]|uniref:Reverse transcriptase domain-containing protein n=1 Tax=Eimeria mitis TaxID=44415 RepID=U6KEJ7_9EIME|nr:uncharacterized protein EMH_0079970 [Eimeria mitis]CDJ36344.1 hypothetical protein EMH_0079970 [Eimeria mitis]
MDIGAVNTKPARHGAGGGYRQQKAISPPRKQEGDSERRSCFFFSKPGRLFRDFRLMKKAREQLKPNPEERQNWAKLKKEFSVVLNNKELPAGRAPAGRPMHRIELTSGSATSFVPRYRRPPHLEEEIERQADELLKIGKVQPSTSAFGHNPVLAKKKDCRRRMCVDFKPPNKITLKQKLPMHRVDEILDRLQDSAVFSAFGFAEAFLQIPIHPEDSHKTAFHTRTRKLEYTCMLFGLVHAPAELRRQVNHDFLGPIAEGWMVIYMDDVLVFSRNVQEPLQHLRQALQLLPVEPDPAKIEAIQRWPLPLYTRTDVQKFLGLASYYRNFIPGFARIGGILTDLLKKKKQFIWTANEDEATRRLIGHLTSSPSTRAPGF